MKHYQIDEMLPRLKAAVAANPSVVLHAPPGAGKTTRVPTALLGMQSLVKGRILMLEPRRIAATSAARWMAKGLGEQVGKTVGYSIRFESRVSPETRIEVVTEGILIRRIQADPGMDGVSMVIFDEFHERGLNADLALALCLDVRRAIREDLKILVMSATLDCGPIASILGGAPVISSGGRTFSVEERYIEDRTKPLPERVAGTVSAALHEASGDILVFLPGAGEIRACNEAIDRMLDRCGIGATVHPLYGDLPFEAQERAILPGEERKIILATNVAETSLTIEGVSVVIDSGLTRRLQYEPSSGLNRLTTISVSKASAEQRTGRAGRLGPGVCYRLYSRSTFQALVPFSPPEILVSDLSSLVLDLAVWGVKDPLLLSWLDAPPAPAWVSARKLLQDLGALDEAGSATPEGRRMSKFPLHPRLARILLRAEEIGCLRLGADIAALLSERDIIRPDSTSGRMVHDKEPDISVRTDILRQWRKGGEAPNASDPWALKAVGRISDQLLRSGKSSIKPSPAIRTEGGDNADMISSLLLCAFPDRIAQAREERDGRFVLVQGRGVRLSSAVSLSRSPYIVAANVDAGEKAEGIVHLAAALTGEIIRKECIGSIRTERRLGWDRREGKIVAIIEERIGSVVLSSKPFSPSDEEALPILCEAISSTPGMLAVGNEARQFQARVSLMRRIFPGEDWPDLSDELLFANPKDWLLPWLAGLRGIQDVRKLDIVPALRARLSWERARTLEERAPAAIIVPSGRKAAVDYAAGDLPVLAVKLQEMFGLADTPAVAGGRVPLLIHLLSPAGRPVQITQDLKGFWNSGYQQVKKELKGRYPKHPWPDDPWNAAPTRLTKRRTPP